MNPNGLTAEEQAEWNRLEDAERSGKTIEISSTPAAAKPEEKSTPEPKGGEQGSDAPKGEPASTDEAKPDAAAPDAKPDPLATLDPALRDYFTGLQTEAARLAKSVSSLAGTVGAMRQQFDAAKEAAKQVRSEGGSAPTSAEIKRASADPAKFAALKDQYPEFAEAIEGFVGAQLDTIKVPQGLSKDEASKLIEERANEIAGARIDRLTRELAVEMAHRGWKQTTASPAFSGWVERQQPEVKKLYSSDQPDDVIRLLDLYEGERKAFTNHTTRMQSAAALNSNPSAPVRGKSFDQMTQQEQWDHLEQLDRQNAQAGRPA